MSRSGAVLSVCGTYRYALHRTWSTAEKHPRALFIMLNPSIADADQDDPTIRRCIDFATRWGYGGLDVANLYAFRATKPSALKAASTVLDVVGPMNDAWIRSLALDANLIVCAWGQLGPDKGRARFVRDLLSQHKIHALAYTKIDDQPRHPLMLKKDLVPLEYST